MARKTLQPQGYRFRPADLQQIIQEEWDRARQDPPGFINRNQATFFLKKVMRRLLPVVPMPDERWYVRVFKNYDRDEDGLIDAKAFWEIVEKFHEYHAQRNERTAQQFLKKQSDNQTPSLDLSQPAKLAFKTQIRFPRDADQGLDKMLQDYEYVDKPSLGEGTFGVARKVRCLSTGEIFCAKEISLKDFSQHKHVTNEIKILEKARHPHIIRFKQSYHSGYTVHLIMEYCAGGEFLTRIRQEHYTDKQIASWMTQLLRGVGYLHKMGIVHRDIKPENIVFVGKEIDSDLKIIDFGLACREEELVEGAVYVYQPPASRNSSTLNGLVSKLLTKLAHKQHTAPAQPVKRRVMQEAGTANYMAPEVIKGDYDHKCDVFSLGIIMYLLCTGRHPFHWAGDSEQDVKNRILTQEPRYDLAEWQSHPKELKSMVKKMLCKDPAERPDAEVLLMEPWLEQVPHDAKCGMSKVTASVLTNLTEWERRSQDQKLRQAFLLLLAVQLSEDDMKGLKQAFIALDQDKDGMISPEDLFGVFSVKGFNLSKEDARRIAASLDTTGQGLIGYDAFLAAVTDTKSAKKSALYRFRCEQLFRKFDPENKGFITTESLAEAMNAANCGYTADDMADIFREVSTSGEGRIGFDEFMTLMEPGDIEQ